MKLNATARAAIRDAGFTLAEWARMYGYESGQGGDACGCKDSRCIGHHHDAYQSCGCLRDMLADAVAWRAAASEPNRIELAAPFGMFRWVTTVTPGVMATVSATAGSAGAVVVNGERVEHPAESVVRIEPREGWTAEVTEENGRIEIRIVKAVQPE